MEESGDPNIEHWLPVAAILEGGQTGSEAQVKHSWHLGLSSLSPWE